MSEPGEHIEWGHIPEGYSRRLFQLKPNCTFYLFVLCIIPLVQSIIVSKTRGIINHGAHVREVSSSFSGTRSRWLRRWFHAAFVVFL